MNIRRTVSLTAALAFVVMVLTSIVLYIAPQGRVAYWADWRLLGLSKTQWGAIHINTGLLFLAALALHFYYNWKPLIQYLKDRGRRLKIVTPAFNLAALLTGVVVVGTLAGWPPLSTVLNFQDAIKAAAARKYGEPPYGHAERSTLTSFARKTGLDPQAALAALAAAGYQAAGVEQTLQELATANGVSPQVLYEAMTPPSSAAEGRPRPLPPTLPPGTGRLTLEAIGREYGRDPANLVQALAGQGIQARGDMTLKEIAAAHNLSPVEIYNLLRTAVAEAPAG